MNSKRTIWNRLGLLAILTVLSTSVTAQNYPKTKKESKTSTFHGKQVTDDYVWLDNVDDEAVVAWTKAQDKATVDFVRGLPQYEALKEKVGSLMQMKGRTMLPVQAAGNYYYAMADEQGAWGLYQQSGAGAPTKLELPFDARAAFFVLPSPQGNYLALGVAQPGRFFDWMVFDLKNGKLQESKSSGAQLGDSRLAWTKDETGFYYVGLDKGDEANQRSGKKVRFHAVNNDSNADELVYTPEAEGSKLHLDVSDDGQYLVIAEREGASTAGKIRYMNVKGPDKAVKELVSTAEASYIFLGNDGPKFYFQTDLGASNGKIVSVNINQATRVWKDLIVEKKVPMMGFQAAGGTMLPLIAGDKFVVPVQKDLKISLKVYSLTGKLEETISMPTGGLFFRSNGLNVLSGNRDSDDIMAQFIGIIEPNTIFNANVKTGKVTTFRRAKVQFNADNYKSEIVFTKSKDGTRIPISLTYKKGMKRNGKNYMMMQVYGSAAFTNYPYFQGDYMAWLDMGGIHAVAHIRGGGAYGSEWHQAGIARNKQNGIDDYIATLEWAIKNKYTTADRMVINAVSAGTIPVGAVMTQRPDLVKAVVSHYGMLDMIGYAAKLGEDLTHGYMLPEIGKATDADDFKVLNAYSPYQKLNSQVTYPAFLALTSEMDKPLNSDSYKFVARLQQVSKQPALLQMAWGSGHSAFGSPQHSPVDTFTDEMAFLIKALNINVNKWLK